MCLQPTLPTLNQHDRLRPYYNLAPRENWPILQNNKFNPTYRVFGSMPHTSLWTITAIEEQQSRAPTVMAVRSVCMLVDAAVTHPYLTRMGGESLCLPLAAPCENCNCPVLTHTHTHSCHVYFFFPSKIIRKLQSGGG